MATIKLSTTAKNGPAPRHGEPWTDDEDAALRYLVGRGETPAFVAGVLQRSQTSVQMRFVKLTEGSKAIFERFPEVIAAQRAKQAIEH